jgi:hypothetical protein
MNRISSILATVLLLPAMLFVADDSNSADKIVPPPPVREFRAAWIATVGNSCWPSKPGLTTTQQKAELIALLDRAVALKLNAVIFQVRPASDALYASSFEPWSEYLTGVQGRAPSPYYDPLDFAIAEAHKRGLELHAWFNPFRAHHFQSVSPIAPNHISHTQPQLVRSYGRYLWLDPGDPAVREYSLRVVMDVVKRYDVDGIHFDDYFYPYREKNSAGMEIDFPDGATWKQYGMNSGLSRDDWRRQNVDIFIQQVYSRHQGGEAVGEVRHQPVRHLAAEKSAGHQRLRFLRRALRRLAQMAARRLVRLSLRRSFTGASQPPQTSFTTLLGCKPNSVCPEKIGGENHLSQQPIPETCSAERNAERAAPRFPIWPCTRWGFPCLARLPGKR